MTRRLVIASALAFGVAWSWSCGSAADVVATDPAKTSPPAERQVTHWTVEDRAAASADLAGIWASAPNDVWAVGAAQTIIHFDGTSWTAVDASPSDAGDLHAIWGSSPNDVYVAQNTGIVHFDGHQWTTALAGAPYMSISGTSSSNVFAAGTGIAHFDGTKWASAPELAGYRFTGVWAAAPNDAYAVGFDTLLHYDGSAWTLVAAPIAQSIAFTGIFGSSARDIYAFGRDLNFGVAYVLHFNGTRWSLVTLPISPLQLSSGWQSGPNDVYMVGTSADGSSYLVHFDGVSWSATRYPLPYRLTTVFGTDANNVFIGGESGIVARKAGQSWTVVNEPGVTLTDLRRVAPAETYALATDGSLFHAGGVDWLWIPPEPSTRLAQQPGFTRFWGTSLGQLSAIFSYSTNDRASGYRTHGGIASFDGTRWNTVAAAQVGDRGFIDVYAQSPTNVFIVGTGGSIYHFDGTSWTPMESGTPGDVVGIWGSSATDVFAVDGSNILHFDGTRWTTMFKSQDYALAAVWGSSPTDVYVGGYELAHYDGASWTKVLPYGTSGLSSIVSIDGSGPSDVYVVYGSGQVFHYDGKSWSAVQTPYTESLRRVRVLSRGDVYLIGANRTILHGTP